MAVYWILIVGAAAVGIPLCGLCEKKSDRRLTIYCVIFGLVLTILSAVRFSVGYDYNMYAMLFYKMNFMDYEDIGYIQREMGMLFPVKVLEILTIDYVPQFVMLSVFMYPPLMVYLRKYSDNPWVGIFAFLAFGVFFNSLNFTRQFFAAIICAYAYKYAEKGNFFRFAVFVLLAACFHRSAFMILPCYIFVYIGMNGFVLALTLITSVSAFLLSNEFVGFVTQYVYKGYDLSRNVEVIKGLPMMYFMMYGAIFAAAFLLRKRLSGSEREKNILLWCSYGAFFFELIGSKHGIVSRISLLFFIPTVFLLVPKIWCALCGLLKEKLPKRFSAAGVITAAAVMITAMSGVYYSLLERNYNGVVPYQTFAVRGDSGDE